MKTVFLDYSDPIELGQTYLDCLRNLGVLFMGPGTLKVLSNVNVRVQMPGGEVTDTTGMVVREFAGPVYGLQLNVTPETEHLVHVAKECAAELQARMLTPGSRDEARAGPSESWDIDGEDTEPERAQFVGQMTPTEQVLSQAYERFRKWLNIQDAVRVPKPGELQARLLAATPPPRRRKSRSRRKAEAERVLLALPAERKKGLAVSSGPEIRGTLMKDPDMSLRVWLLRNPDITESEVYELSCAPDLPDDAVYFLLERRKWCQYPRIATNLLLHKSVSSETRTVLASVLPTPTLKGLLRRDDIPVDATRAAREILQGRTDQTEDPVKQA